MERANTVKFLGALLEDNLSWKEHMKYLENKIAKNKGLMNRAKPFLHKESLLVFTKNVKSKMIEQTEFIYSSLGKAFEKQM